MNFTSEDVKSLREKTGCGMMDCKKALIHSDGNLETAVIFLREQGLAALNKKSGKLTSEGITLAVSEPDKGVIIEVNSETDFVANNKEFRSFVEACVDCILKNDVNTVQELFDLEYKGMRISEILQSKILTMGENIKIRRFNKVYGFTSSYVHLNGKISVLVEFGSIGDSFHGNENFKEVMKNVAMQIAACNPAYIESTYVEPEIILREKKIIEGQIADAKKPPAVIEKIVEGKILKFFKEVCLMEQPFVKEPSITVSKYLDQESKKIGKEISVKNFFRYERGEDIEKKDKKLDN